MGSPDEGDRVHAGQLVAVLENADFKAQIQTAAAQVKQNEAEVRKTVNGARTQERRGAPLELNVVTNWLKCTRL